MLPCYHDTATRVTHADASKARMVHFERMPLFWPQNGPLVGQKSMDWWENMGKMMVEHME